jgi:tetratricopeptide (TPR) repeat protein
MAHRSRLLSLLAVTAFALASCETASSPQEIARDEKAGRLEEAAAKLEKDRNSDPDDFSTRMKLGEIYYELARKEIDKNDQAGYIDYLRKAQIEILAAAKLEPTDPSPHTWLGIITAYEGDLKGSETSFRNALRLAEEDRYHQYGGTFFSNLAHICVYKGDLQAARRYLDKAAKTGAPQDELDRISVLLAWKENDMVEARDVFNGGVTMSHAFAETWDGAPLPKKMETFDDFAETCCKNPTCGPHMESACKRERQEVARRQLDLSTVEEQSKIEQERREELRKIYKAKKGGVDITVDDDPNAAAPQNAPAPAPTKPK